MISDQTTQTRLAQLTGISQSTISRYLRGGVQPSKENERRLIAALPSLRRLFEARTVKLKAGLRADAEAVAPHLFIPSLPASFRADGWNVSYTEAGFPDSYELSITCTMSGKEYHGVVRILYGVDAAGSRQAILNAARDVVAELRDAAGVIT
jgi:transcriptional regulator with XRE-family HTH domain